MLTQDQMLSVLSDFYNGLITILVLFISILGAFTYYSVKTLSRKEAEDIAEKEVGRAIDMKFQDKTFVKEMLENNEQISYFIDELNTKGDGIVNNEKKIKNLENRLMALEYYTMSGASKPLETKKSNKKKAGEADGSKTKKTK